MTLTDAEYRALNPRGPNDTTQPDPVIPVRFINDVRFEVLGSHKAAASNAVATFEGSNLLTATSIGSTTSAAGTQVDFPRNLRYEINISGDATGMVSAGTVSVGGWDILSSAITETVALTDIASAGSASHVNGTKIFHRLSASAITVSGYLLATASSSRSNSISFYLGVGSVVGVPVSIRSTNAVPIAYIGTDIQVGSYTVVTGDVGTAGISFSNALATGTPVNILRYLTR